MNHYNVAQWSDYVRRVGAEAERAGMRRHLESGCAKCHETVAWLESVAELAAFDATIQIPNDVLLRAQAIFEPSASVRWTADLKQLVATLVAQASPEWQPAGLRSGAGTGIRTVYRAGEFSVNLQVEASGNEGTADIAGQIVHQGDPQAGADALVQIIAADQVLAHAEANQFGEFLFEQAPRRNAILRIAMKRFGVRIDLSLQNQLADHI